MLLFNIYLMVLWFDISIYVFSEWTWIPHLQLIRFGTHERILKFSWMNYDIDVGFDPNWPGEEEDEEEDPS